MATQPAGREWTTTEAQGATFVELFFDLVFVFAVTSITGLLLENLDWAGVGHSVLILWLVWWAWTQFTWTLNPADTNHPAVRLITLAATAAAFFMAQAIPDAFTSAGAWFACAYVTVRVLGLGLQLGLLSSFRENASTLMAWLTGSGIGLVAVLVGGLVASPWREILWTAAVAFDLLSAARAGRGRWHLHAAHFAERHGLIVIIALGESLIAAGVSLGPPRDATFAVGAISAVVAVCALWWLYFGLAKDELEDHLASRTDDEVGGVARNIYSWGHLPIIAGIIAFAVAIEEALSHPDEALGPEALVALGLGVILYLSGIAYGLHRTGNRSPVPWAIAMVVVTLTVLATAQSASGLIPLLAVTAVLVAFAIWGSWSRRPTGAASAPPG